MAEEHEKIKEAGKRQRTENNAKIVIAAFAVFALVLGAAWMVLRPEAVEELPYLGRSDAPFDVQLSYSADVNYCQAQPLPLNVVITAQQDVAQPVLGYRSDSLRLEETGAMEGRISLAPLEAGKPAYYTLNFQREPMQLLHQLDFFPTMAFEEGMERPFNVTPPKLLVPSSAGSRQVNEVETVQFYLANCADVPLEGTHITITPSVPVQILQPNQYGSYDEAAAETDAAPVWHLTVFSIPSDTIYPVQFSYVAKAPTEDMVWHIRAEKTDMEGTHEDEAEMRFGPVRDAKNP